jgi:arginase
MADILGGMALPIAVLGVPTALGGHFDGMDRAPGDLRRLGLLERTGLAVEDTGDLPIEPGFQPDPDPRAKNRELISAMLPRLAERVAMTLSGQPTTRLLILGGDCTSHAGTLAGIRRARPNVRIGLAWFDAHGDFNTPDTTPSGNVWGMPFAMICGRGDRDLVAAAEGPTVRMEDAALLGGQVLDERESRDLASSPVAHFGAGMLATPAGQAALDAWARALPVDALYIAFDVDAIDASERVAVAMPEPRGLPLATALDAISIVANARPVIGFGATGVSLANGDPERTVAAVAALADAALRDADPVRLTRLPRDQSQREALG